MRKIGWQGRTLALVLGLLLTSKAGARISEDEVARWQEALAGIDGSLRAGEWASAETAAGELLAQMVEANPDPSLSALMSVAVLSVALAEAGNGSTEDALWHWMAAQNLNPRLRRARFPAYGPAGAFLEEHRLRLAGSPPEGLSPVALRPGMAAPANRASYWIPQAWSRFELVVAADGSVHAPVAVVPPWPAAMVESIEALRDLQLEPARADGEPVVVYWRPRPELWILNRAGLPSGPGTELRGDTDRELEESLATCTALGTVMETTGTAAGTGDPWLGAAPGMVETVKRKALRKEADTLVLDNYDAAGVKGRAFRCGADWYPPDYR